ncbi:putative bifunctional diguanylate cyclase/phosphodiesterase [Butyrivibrio sp. NC3005]|uniref:putative bifunctional diguanylate cyclase/phosphodiesterase n=1 Tax=Butyrivibrio sp. NC3005 TaxID=1280685 RepID=UPI00047C7355|nr:bifunctional diguanylate cyclase/phosphodiesterase [Butyrivibrio sp. NC3005]
MIQNIKSKKTILGILACTNIAIIMFTVWIGICQVRQDEWVMNLKIPVSGINGSLQTLVYLNCILMTITNYQIGTKLSIFSIVLSLANISRAIFGSKNYVSIPGFFNCFLQLLSIVILSRQFRIRENKRITDRVTGLGNRYGFEEVLSRKLDLRKNGSILYIHLKGIMQANIDLGRNYGDELLNIVAKRICSVLEENGTAFRISGTEYAIILLNGVNPQAVSRDLLEEIEKKIVITINETPRNCYLNGVIGIVKDFGKEENIETILQHADIAMNFAAKSFNEKICIYDEEVKNQVDRRNQIERLIKESLEKDYFYLEYQPQFLIDGKILRGFETLCRMKLPDGTLISPSEFIPIAESSNIIIDLDEYVIRKALEQFKNLCNEYGDSITLSVNVSAKGIALPDFPNKLLEIIEKADFPRECLEIEITEYSLSDSPSQTMKNVEILRANGVKLALDDFGSGYTSLAQLLHIPVSRIKIDKSMIENIDSNQTNKDFVKTMIYLGHLMKCDVIVEGVEDYNQYDLVRDFSGDLIQGFMWGKPQSLEDTVRLCSEYLVNNK